MARTVIQSNISKNKIVKLSYSVRGLYQIVRRTVFCSYYVRKLHKPDRPELNFVAYDIYLFPLSLKPSKPVDTIDTRYLNQTHAPLAHLLKNALYIQLYNEKLFTKPIPTSAPAITYQYDTLQLSEDSSLIFPSMLDYHKETKTYPPKTLLEKEG